MSVSNKIETITKIFTHCDFEQISKYSVLISDISTYFCYMIIATVDNNQEELIKYTKLHADAQEKLTELVIEIYKKHGTK